MARRRIRSISVPITFGAVTVPLSAFLLVGWTTFTARNLSTGEVPYSLWMLVLGVVSFGVIMSVLVLFSIFLAREILEVRRQDGFIDSVTHELKTPLASLKLGLQTLEREGLPPDKREAIRRMMRDDVERLETFIDDILQASRLAHDEVSTDVDEVRLYELVRQCADTIAARYQAPVSAFRIEIDPGLVVSTDRVALEIVVRNLLDNAVKYSRDSVQVEVRACAIDGGRTVEIEVRDRGIGIPRKDLRRIFQRFYRVPDERVRARKGTGLGLFVVSELVRNLGGHVKAESEGPGKGSLFRVRLPTRLQEAGNGLVRTEAGGSPEPLLQRQS